MPPLFLIIIVCIDSWVTGEFTLFSSKLLLSLWPMVSATILGVTIVTLGTTPVISGACMLMYGPACLCMCLQASVHSCSAGPFFLELHPYDCNLRWNSFSQSSFKSNFNYVTVNLHYVSIHPSMHLCLCVCVYAFVKYVCMHLHVHNIVCSAQPEVAAVLDWYGPEAEPAYWQTGREEVAGLQVACEAHNLHVY